MDYALLLIFKCINQAVICNVEGNSMSFQNGSEAIAKLQETNKHYSPINISAKNDTVVISIKDITEEIQQSNEDFIKDYKKQFGYEPSFFE